MRTDLRVKHDVDARKAAARPQQTEASYPPPSQWALLAKDVINSTARLTQRFTAGQDPSRPRYVRMPRGKICAFCLMLTSHGFAYLSEDTAGRQMQYHADCDCDIVPS